MSYTIHAHVLRRVAGRRTDRVERSHSLTDLGVTAHDQVKPGSRLTSTSFDLKESDYSRTRCEKGGGRRTDRVVKRHSLTHLGAAARDQVKSGARQTTTSFDLKESDNSRTCFEKGGGAPYRQSRETSLTHPPRRRRAWQSEVGCQTDNHIF
jgi:hypothetical protein